MERRVLFFGPAGAGKTEAIRTISDIEVVSTEEAATNEVALLKSATSVAMDVGVVNVDDDGKVVLYGAPGQDRFGFMWEILLEQTEGVVLLIDDSWGDGEAALAHYVCELRRRTQGSPPPLVVGITHADAAPPAALDGYRRYLREHADDFGGERIPVLRTDARNRRDVRNLLLALTAMLEFDERLRGPAGVL